MSACTRACTYIIVEATHDVQANKVAGVVGGLVVNLGLDGAEDGLDVRLKNACVALGERIATVFESLFQAACGFLLLLVGGGTVNDQFRGLCVCVCVCVCVWM